MEYSVGLSVDVSDSSSEVSGLGSSSSASLAIACSASGEDERKEPKREPKDVPNARELEPSVGGWPAMSCIFDGTEAKWV